MSVAENIQEITSRLPGGVRLVAVSKFHPAEMIQEAYDAGQRLFGENHAQELVAKAPVLPRDVEWHFIGHLQKNKVRSIMPWVGMIESVDSLPLLRLIEKEAARIDRRVDVLLQLHVAREETKTGFAPDELLAAAQAGELDGFGHVRFCGLMAMATNTDNRQQIADEFETVRRTFVELSDTCFDESETFNQLSIGMSHDWPIAVQHGATIVRVGTDIFGPREY